MATTTYSVIIDALSRAAQDAANDAAGYADMGQAEDSIFADGRADGLRQALDIVRNLQRPGQAIVL